MPSAQETYQPVLAADWLNLPENLGEADNRPGAGSYELLHMDPANVNSDKEDNNSMGSLGQATRGLGGYRTTVMRTLGHPVFDASVFVTQVLLNALEPFSAVGAWAVLGSHKAVNLGLWVPYSISKRNLSLILHHFEPLMMFISLWLYLSYPALYEAGHIPFQEILMWPFVCMMVQKTMVAYKYAMLTEEEYNNFLEAPYEVARIWNKNLQLLTGWMPLPDEILTSEIRIASHRVGRNIYNRSFVHEIKDEESLQVWGVIQAVVKEGSSSMGYKVLQSSQECSAIQKMHLEHAKSFGIRRINAQKMLATLLRVSRDGAFFLDTHHCVLLSVVFVLVPPIHRILEYHSMPDFSWDDPLNWRPLAQWLQEALTIGIGGGSWPVTISWIIGMRMVCKYNSIVTAFMAAAAAHYHRTYLLTTFLAHLARPVQDTHPNLPQLQLEGDWAEENLESLLLCFEISVHYGPRYRARLDVYVATVGICACLSLVMLYILLGNTLEQEANSGDSQTAHLQMIRTMAIVICANVAVIFALILAMILAAASANEAYNLLSRNLVSRRWRKYYEQRKPTFYKANRPQAEQSFINEESEQFADAFELAVERINCLAATSQVRIAGFEASQDLAFAVAGTVYPVILLILGKLFFPGLAVLSFF